MKVNFHVRCVTDAVVAGMPCQIIRYGVTTEEANKNLNFPAWRDMRTPTYDYYTEKVFIHAKEKDFYHPTSFQADSDAFDQRAFYQGRGIRSPQGIKADKGSFGRSHKGWKTK